MRTTKEFLISNKQEFKRNLLTWSKQFAEICWLDSNEYPQQSTSFDALLAVEAFTAIKTDFLGAFDQLQEYQEITADWIFGYLSYDLKNDVEDLTSTNFDGLHFPDLYFFQPSKIIRIKGDLAIFDYLRMVDDEMESDFEEISNKVESGERRVESQDMGRVERGERRVDSQYAGKEDRGQKEEDNSVAEETLNLKPETLNSARDVQARISKERYLEKVERMLYHIHRGDIYEANFCQEFYVENRELDPVQIFHKLNEISGSPFAAFLKLENNYLFSASPERYLKKEERKLTSQPIKGTAGRADKVEEDRRVAENLAQDEKERSENVMIVDLVRNDLSRVAKKGSVTVEELCKVYSFKQVHQMISTISAELDEGIPAVEVLRATFPMGSMTGAPKISAMKIIEELEESKRGLYSGAVGYFTPTGDFDFNVVIRSILYNASNKYVSFSVGGAITSRSVPQKEYEECMLKARAMLEVLK